MGLIEVIVPSEQEGSRAVVRSWLKQLGECVMQDDPLVELETDKVTQEIAAPVSGILREIVMQSDEIAMPGAVLARIDSGATTSVVMRETRHSPAVRKMAVEYGIDPDRLKGTGRDGRVTRADMQAAYTAVEDGKARSDSCSRRIQHSPMRQAIARNMVASVMRAPHVTALIEVDFTSVQHHRQYYKLELAKQGISLSYTAYVALAAAEAMRAVPEVNSRWHDNELEIYNDVDIGIGTALADGGLVVPVIRKAQELTLDEVALQLQELSDRARRGKLTAEELTGSSFTISNHGVSGTLLAAPVILHDGQSAILGVGKLEKRAVVRQIEGADALVIRPMAYVSLTIDHRVLDGHQTNCWLSDFAKHIESWEVSCTPNS